MQKLDLKNIHEWPASMRYLLIGFLCAGVFYFAYIMDFSDFKRALSVSQQQEHDLNQQFEIMFRQQADLENDIAQFTELQKMFEDWQKKLIKSSDLPELLNQILKLGTANGLEFSLFTPGDQITEGSYLKVPIKIVALGSYNQIANFISQVANMTWIVVIGDFSISKPDIKLTPETNNMSHQLKTELILEVYYQTGK